MRRLKVLIADDHELMVEAVRIALSQQEDEFEVVAATSRGTQVLPLIAQTEPDIVLRPGETVDWHTLPSGRYAEDGSVREL